MTKEQAVRIIKMHCYFANLVPDAKKALDMAIKALEQQPSDDCVSREQAIKTISTDIELNLEGRSGLLKYSDEIKDILKTLLDSQEKKLKALPPVIPTHSTCKDCKHYYMDEDGHCYHCEKFEYTRFPVYADFYCADYEKRGDSNGSD